MGIPSQYNGPWLHLGFLCEAIEFLVLMLTVPFALLNEQVYHQ